MAASKVYYELKSNPKWRQLSEHRESRDIEAFDEELSRDFQIGGADYRSGKKISYVLFQNRDDGSIRGLAHFGSHTAGNKGIVHGGASATMADVAMGMLVWWTPGMNIFTGELKLRYHQPMPTNTTVVVDAHFDTIEGRKHHLSATLSSLDPKRTDASTLDVMRPVSSSTIYLKATSIYFKMKPQEENGSSTRLKLQSKL